MRILFRWIILVLIVLSIATIAAIAIPRYLLPASTLHFWALDGFGAYHYYYDFRTESLYLDERWNLNAQIAPNGTQAVILRDSRRNVIIELLRSDGTREALGEFPLDLLDHEAHWSHNSDMIYLAARTDNSIAVYQFEIATRELTALAEYEEVPSDTLAFTYDADENMLMLIFINFGAENIFKLYDVETGEQWTIEANLSLTPFAGWEEYLTLVSLEDNTGNAIAKQELRRVSLLDNSVRILPLPPEGEVGSISFIGDEKHLLLSTLAPDASYILDLETEEYKLINTKLALTIQLYSPDERFALALDYRFFQSGGTGIIPWYMLNLETYDVQHLFNRYNFNILQGEGRMAWSSDNKNLAVINNSLDKAYIEIFSLETGQLLHRFELPDNRLGTISSNFGTLLEWYQP